MPTTSLAPVTKQQFLDSNGNPLSGGKVYTYAAGTTTPQATYTDSTGTAANANPVILDSSGRANIWLDIALSYKIVLKDSSDNTIYTTDNVIGLLTNNSVPTAALQSNSVTNSKLAQMPTNTLKGNNTASTADPLDLTVSEVLTLLGIKTITPQGRLTLSSTAPVMTADATAQTSVYYLPYNGRIVPVYDSTRFIFRDIGASGLTMSLNTSNQLSGSLYDLFAFMNGSTLAIGAGPAWSSSTTRGTGAGTTELEVRDGLWVNKNAIVLKNGSTTYSSTSANQATYLGSIYCTANGQTGMNFRPASASGGTANVLGVYNAYNRVRVRAVCRDSGTYTYASASTWRNANNSTSNRITFIDGLQQSPIDASYSQEAANNTAGAVTVIGAALDSNTPTSSVVHQASIANHKHSVTHIDGFPPVLGVHYVQATEWISAGTSSLNPSGIGAMVLTANLEM